MYIIKTVSPFCSSLVTLLAKWMKKTHGYCLAKWIILLLEKMKGVRVIPHIGLKFPRHDKLFLGKVIETGSSKDNVNPHATWMFSWWIKISIELFGLSMWVKLVTITRWDHHYYPLSPLGEQRHQPASQDGMGFQKLVVIWNNLRGITMGIRPIARGTNLLFFPFGSSKLSSFFFLVGCHLFFTSWIQSTYWRTEKWNAGGLNH